VTPPILARGDVVLTRFSFTEAVKNIMAEHSNKHIQEAIRYAESHGWVVTQAGPRAHIWGMPWCPHHARDIPPHRRPLSPHVMPVTAAGDR
jgi:hypothetical protein